MNKLLYKELRLAMHPAALLFLALSAMLLIPNYPYLVIFFYSCLGIFFICLSGRENQDITFTLLLPIPKGDAVLARFLSTCLLQLAQIILCIPFTLLRRRIMPEGNAAGLDANIALFGFAFLMLGLFNRLFLCRYYKNTDKVGRAFAWPCVYLGLYFCLEEAACHIIPFFRDKLDTPDPAFLPEKIAALAIGLAAYVLLTFWSYIKSRRTFEALDL